jgi:hypothetical protein
MANVNNPHGLRPLMRTQAGGAPQCEQFSKAVGYAYAIYKWDPVTELAGVFNGPASGITPGITRFLGVALDWAVASVASTHHVMVDPGAIFEAQGDGSGSGANVISAATMGYKANLNVATTAGGGVTRDNSGVQVTETTIAVTSSLDVTLLQLLQEIDNAYGVNGRVELKFNKHLRNPEVTAT